MKENKPIELVTLVDKSGNVRGYAEKIDAHLRGDLHLAFSLMLMRQNEDHVEYLLQRRALNKYHSGGLWANTCCSHPRPNETIEAAAQRRVQEELGVSERLALQTIGQICYEHPLDNNMIEHEYDHIVVSEVDDVEWQANVDEAMDVKW
jgi:isopentenyl-diphosphate delta-isomerase